MFKFNFTTIIALSAALITGAANANASVGAIFGPGDGKEQSDLEDLHNRCLRVGKYKQVDKPAFVGVRCEQKEYFWAEAQQGQRVLDRQRQVNTSIATDKLFLQTSRGALLEGTDTRACVRLQRMEHKLTIERNLSCEEYVGLVSDKQGYDRHSGEQRLDQFCIAQFDAGKKNGKGMPGKDGTATAIDGFIDTCAAPIQ